LPPFNGFLGELAIYIGAFSAIKTGIPVLVAAGFLAAVSLALAGAFAVAAYAKSIGCVFLGEPRSDAAAQAVESPRRMWIAQFFLTLLSVAMMPGTLVFIHCMTGDYATDMLVSAAIFGIVFALITGALLLVRNLVCPRGNEKPRLPVWDCGYDRPTARMAYTATAFTQPIVDLFRPLLRTRSHVVHFKGDPASPSDAAIATETDDIAIGCLWRPLFTKVARLFQRVHLLQSGSLHLYILIILIAVLALLVSALVS
jgi:hypothetical protein